jgi:ATP/maltotriose-dependent transcriptional regulator MalT
MGITKNKTYVSAVMLKQLMLQSEKESLLSTRLNMAAIILSYSIINVILLLESVELGIIAAACVAMIGLAILIFISYYREMKIHKRTVRNLDALLTPEDLSQKGNLAIEALPAGNLLLTTRELEILSHVAHGQTDKAIAAMLGVSSYTIKNHLRKIFQKLEVDDRTSAVLLAVRYGWFKIDESAEEYESSTGSRGTSVGVTY